VKIRLKSPRYTAPPSQASCAGSLAHYFKCSISFWTDYVYRDAKATGDDDVPGDVLKLLGEVGLKIMTKLINTIYETGEWPKDFTEVTMIALKKKPQATNCSDHRTISLIAHTAKIVAKIFRRTEKKIKAVLREDQFGFRRGKGTRDAIGMLRIISDRTLEIDEELCVCFIEWQRPFTESAGPN
jgi:hypothetical protein